MRSRRIKGIAISATIAVAILVILLAANLAPYDRQCAWVFPKILSCLLSARETLAAGLIAAGGALFAAWLAWSGLQDQIGMARRTEQLARQVENEKRVNDSARDVDRIKSAHGFTSALFAEFPAVGDPAAAKGAFAARLLELRRTGKLTPSEHALQAPDGYGESVKTVMTRLSTFAENLYNETKDLSAEIKGGTLRVRDPEVIEHVRNLHQLSDLLRLRVLLYEQKFADAVARSKSPGDPNELPTSDRWPH